MQFEAEHNHVPRGLKDPNVVCESTNSIKYILLMAFRKSVIGTLKKNAFIPSGMQEAVYLSQPPLSLRLDFIIKRFSG